MADRTGLNISNVRFYERKGLLTPDREEVLQRQKGELQSQLESLQGEYYGCSWE